MTKSWNEIREAARGFASQWKDETREAAEGKTFWDEFFRVFGIQRRKLASFEQPVKHTDGNGGFIDLLWRGVMLVEHKSAGKDLTRAAKQALTYFPGIKDRDLPRYVVVSDFRRIRLYDLEPEVSGEAYIEFALTDLHKHVRAFAFMLGMRPKIEAPETLVNRKAVLKLAGLHDKLSASGYTGVPLELLMTRLVFCYFADDTSIFEKNQFKEWIEAHTQEDGSDLGSRLAEVFGILNQDHKLRSTLLSEDLKAFDYVNGGLFAQATSVASFNKSMRDDLLDVSRLEWGQISPAIFGAMFQGLMSKVARRKLGAHYTSERNILRVIEPLFLDQLKNEFSAAVGNKPKLKALHEKLRKIHIFDPACGCGNFLVVAYRELRGLELKILCEFYQAGKQQMLPSELDQEVLVNVDQFHGIEIDNKSAHIARLAMWLTDHQMNLQIGEVFGTYYRRLPLVKAPNIVTADALEIDWHCVLPVAGPDGTGIVYVIGNPPFLGPKNFGAHLAPAQQRSLANELLTVAGSGVLDLVSGWYVKAAKYIANTNVRCAFVSTSSIVQGEQVGVLWSWMLAQGMHIHFAHRSFPWSNEASGQAGVDCVVVGFAAHDTVGKVIYDYPDGKDYVVAMPAAHINPYLVDFEDILLLDRSTPLQPGVPAIGIGNKPIDGGYYLFNNSEKAEFLARESKAEPLFKRWFGSEELLDGIDRWCLYVGDQTPVNLRSLPQVMKQIELVRSFRRGDIANRKGVLRGTSTDTKAFAETPLVFHVTNMPKSNFLVFPRHSGEKRRYIPIAFCDPSVMVGDACLISSEAELFHFGVLTSSMHNAWVRYTCGRLTSRFRYSKGIVYNNFPWPDAELGARRAKIEEAAQTILDIRGAHFAKGSTLADIYDPTVMPEDLRNSHRALDRAVDGAYGKRAAMNDNDRIKLLFGLWKALNAPIMAEADRAKKAKETKRAALADKKSARAEKVTTFQQVLNSSQPSPETRLLPKASSEVTTVV